MSVYGANQPPIAWRCAIACSHIDQLAALILTSLPVISLVLCCSFGSLLDVGFNMFDDLLP